MNRSSSIELTRDGSAVGQAASLPREAHRPGSAWPSRQTRAGWQPAPRARGFTLIEMLVVLAIIGIVAGMTLPAFKGMGQGSKIDAATRQLMDDLMFARLKAISGRTTVYVVFMPRQSSLRWNTGGTVYYGLTMPPASAFINNYFMTNLAANGLLGLQQSGYAMFAVHSVGDQPGETSPRFLTEWSSLPDGTAMPHAALTNAALFHNNANNSFVQDVPLADESSPLRQFNPPYVAFDAQGRLVGRTTDLVIPVIEASRISQRLPNVQEYDVADVDTVETAEPIPNGGIVGDQAYFVSGNGGVQYPSGGTFYAPGTGFIGQVGVSNYTAAAGARVTLFYGVRVNWLTGRAKVVKPEIR